MVQAPKKRKKRRQRRSQCVLGYPHAGGDGTLCGSPTDLAAALRIVEQERPSRGLKLNRAKSLVYIPDGGDPSNNLLPSDIPITKNGFTLLGCPIGPSSFCDSIFSKRVEKVKQSIARLPDLQDSQMEMALLRFCLALPKVSPWIL